jgi:hypothetical protein
MNHVELQQYFPHHYLVVLVILTPFVEYCRISSPPPMNFLGIHAAREDEDEGSRRRTSNPGS